ncbi:hypothetical protein EOD41_08175 [Mucilaginibacter limnophilus]|uniref:Glycerophosphoryl diester phosphodiesterase membrane domain-containing protein n=1 Tax=Mucilaginibacter limnophilus TaxID=1932778 RepID=A0A3S2UQE3_9SPHI|nr:glycerophosphoryl diester phosphodiesterase membrane domain-containing protein [Mucilaginibacter limnophilus]RVU01922.1 hypothetical protein EOD41_08175 [Mucilaginibacter limnophilus]
MKPYFELRRIRDFGEIISDTFTFFKENFKDLFKPMLIICSVFILLNLVTLFVMQRNAAEGVSAMANGTYNNDFDLPRWSINAFISSFIYYFSYLFFNFSIFIITYSYIAVFKEKPEGEKPTLNEVWGYYRYYFLRAVGSSIVCTLLIGIGIVFCLLPGIYFGIVLCLVLPVIIFENASFGYAFNKSFTLIKGNWWLTFGVLIVLFLVLLVSSLIIIVPSAIIQQTQLLINPEGWIWPVFILLMLFYNLFLLSYSLVAIAISMCYFSYSEQKDGTGLIDRINTLGMNDQSSHLPNEEF